MFQKYVSLLCCLAISCSLYCQVENFYLGGYELKTAKKKSVALLEKVVIGSAASHAKIGGISFEQVAVPGFNLSSDSIVINYLPLNVDGSRLNISFHGGKDLVAANILDWQLIPIAKYADSQTNAVFTLIGDQGPFGETSRIQYHPAFANTILGLRMLQADLLFASDAGDFLSQVPTDTKGNALLAGNEASLMATRTDTIPYAELWDNVKEHVTSYNSYMLTDWGREIMFSSSDNKLYISGEPYYLFTSNTRRNFTAVLETIREISQMEQDLSFTKTNEYRELAALVNAQGKPDHNKVLNALQRLVEKNEEAHWSLWFDTKYSQLQYGNYDRDTVLTELRRGLTLLNVRPPFMKDTAYINIIRLKDQELYSWTRDVVMDNLYTLTYAYEEPFESWFYSINAGLRWPNSYGHSSHGVDLLLCESKAIETKNQSLYNFNPVVFSACTITMRYAAFFRYVKENNPAAWKKFMEQVNQVKNIKPCPQCPEGSPVNGGIITPNEITRRK